MKIFYFILFITVSMFCNAKKTVHVEEYYFVDNDGCIHYDSIIERRTIQYHNECFVSGSKISKGNVSSLSDDKDDYYSMQNVERHDSIIIYHNYQYNEWKDPIIDNMVIEDNEKKMSVAITYEYFYLNEFKYSTNSKGVTAISGYENDYNKSWLRRTVRKDGKIVQYINRKIEN